MSRDLLPQTPTTSAVQAHGGDRAGMPAIDETEIVMDVSGKGATGNSSGEGASRKPQPKSGYASLMLNGKIEPGAAGSRGHTLSRSGSGVGPVVGGQMSLKSGAGSSLKRSVSAGSLISKTSAPAWAKPILRRALSATSKGTTDTAENSIASSDISGLDGLDDIREEKSMKVDYKTPCSTAYVFKEKCGEGGFGTVWRAQKAGTEEVFAVKRTKAKEEKDMQRTIRELKAFERFTHPNLVTLHAVFLDQEHLYMVMDLCTGGDLHQYLSSYCEEAQRMRSFASSGQGDLVGLPTRIVAILVWQMLAGIAYMHHHRFMHRDIKLQNFVIKEPSDVPRLQLVDFGMATRFRRGKPITGTMGTVKYMAPEVLKGPYTEKCDIWSIGVCTYILCTARSPWGTKKSNQALAACIVENQREKWPACDKPMALRSLIETMMTRKVETRPTAKQLLQTKWLRSNGMPSEVTKQDGPGEGPNKGCCAIS